MGIELERALRTHLYAVDSEEVIFDSVAYEFLQPYFSRLENGDNIAEVLRDYVRLNLKSKAFSVTIPLENGETETREVKIYNNLAQEPFQTIRAMKGASQEDRVAVARKILIALSQTGPILAHGKVTRYVDSDGHAHAGAKFAYALQVLDAEDGSRFPAVAVLMFPKAVGNGKASDQLYQMNVKGSGTFKGRMKQLKGKFIADGDSVKIVV